MTDDKVVLDRPDAAFLLGATAAIHPESNRLDDIRAQLKEQLDL